MHDVPATASEKKMLRRRILKLGAASWACCVASRATAQQPGLSLVAVAASVQRAVEEMAPPWTRATGHRLNFVYGSSGNFLRQIQQGLPVELFLSADERFAWAVADAGAAVDRGVIYAGGRLALLLAPGSSIALDPEMRGLKAAWNSVRKFAIASPELAPYGQAAREALQSVGLWEAAQAKLVVGENVAQATQFVATGAAQAGMTALSLLAGGAQGAGRFIALPESMHAPLRQRMVLLKRAGPAATAFYAYLQSEPAKAILRRHGFQA
jgi:molybdate transport system substrate-binding protein